jgi:hypothetical protein
MRLQPQGVRPALLPVIHLISDCVLENLSATALPQQKPFYQRNKSGRDATDLHFGTWHVIDRLLLDAAGLL